MYVLMYSCDENLVGLGCVKSCYISLGRTRFKLYIKDQSVSVR